MGQYSFGHPNSPQPNDPRFDTLEEAEDAAVTYTLEHPWDSLRAVRRDDDGAVECLVFEGVAYYP